MIRGTVGNIVDTMYRGTKLYSFTLEGDNTFYRTGDSKPPVAIGNNIQFELSNPAKNQVNLKSVKVLGGEPVAEGGGKSSFDQRQASIVYQSSRKDAVEAVKLLVQVVKPEDMFGEGGATVPGVLGLVDDLTKKYIGDVETLEPVGWADFVAMELTPAEES